MRAAFSQRKRLFLLRLYDAFNPARQWQRLRAAPVWDFGFRGPQAGQSGDLTIAHFRPQKCAATAADEKFIGGPLDCVIGEQVGQGGLELRELCGTGDVVKAAKGVGGGASSLGHGDDFDALALGEDEPSFGGLSPL